MSDIKATIAHESNSLASIVDTIQKLYQSRYASLLNPLFTETRERYNSIWANYSMSRQASINSVIYSKLLSCTKTSFSKLQFTKKKFKTKTMKKESISNMPSRFWITINSSTTKNSNPNKSHSTTFLTTQPDYSHLLL